LKEIYDADELPPEPTFDPRAVIKKYCEKYYKDPEMLLVGMMEALARYHVFGPRAFDFEVGRPTHNVHDEIDGLCMLCFPKRDPRQLPPNSLMEALFMELEIERRINGERANEIDRKGDAASDSEWMDGMIRNQLADAQEALCMAIHDCLEQLNLDRAAGLYGDLSQAQRPLMRLVKDEPDAEDKTKEKK
jgi:hypothetical protein